MLHIKQRWSRDFYNFGALKYIANVENIVIYLNQIGSEFLPANFSLSYFVRQFIDSAHLFPPIRVYHRQGDQIGRIFADWALFTLDSFLN
jgi:hypothetical protein